MRFGQVVAVGRSKSKNPFKALFKKRRTPSSRRKKSTLSKLLSFFSF